MADARTPANAATVSGGTNYDESKSPQNDGVVANRPRVVLATDTGKLIDQKDVPQLLAEILAELREIRMLLHGAID